MENQIDEILVTVNNALKQLINGNYVNFSGYMYTIPQQLLTLQKKTAEELEKRETEIKNLRRMLDDLNGGADDGTK